MASLFDEKSEMDSQLTVEYNETDYYTEVYIGDVASCCGAYYYVRDKNQLDRLIIALQKARQEME